MKKLLSMLGAVSLTASAGATVVACNVKNKQSTQMSAFLGGVARAAYLKNRKNYDMNYILENNVLNNADTKAFFDDSFGGKLISDSVKTTGVKLEAGKLPTDLDTITNIASIGENLLSLDQSQDKKQQVIELISSATKMFGLDLTSAITDDTRDSIDKIGETVEVIGKALDMTPYEGKNYVEAVNQAIINFVNEFNKAAGIGKADYTVADFEEALPSITTTISEMKNSGKPFSINFIIQNKILLGTLVDIIKLTLLYITSFISSNDISKSITNQVVIDFRANNKISKNSTLDLKFLVSNLSKNLTGLNSGVTGPVAVRNIIKLLFIEQLETYYSGTLSLNLDNVSPVWIGMKISAINSLKYKAPELGIARLSLSILNGVIDPIDVPVIGKLKIGNVLVALLGMIGSGAVMFSEKAFDKVLEMAGADKLPIPADMLAKVKSLLTSSDPLSMLWDQDILGPILALLGISGNFSLTGILNSPFSQLFGVNGLFGLDFITSGPDKFDTIADLMKLIINKAGDKDIKLSPQQLSNVVTAIGKVIRQLAQTGSMTVEEMVDQLGGSVINDLFSIVGDTQGLKGLFTFLKETAVSQKDQLVNGSKTEFTSLSYDETILSDTQYKYQIEKAQITITIANEGGKNKITVIRLQ